MPINAKLIVVGGEVKTAEIKLRLPSTIGRGRGCTIMLPQALVSRQHCEIFESGGKLMVRDLGSLNGTFVNNQKISEPSPINSEELLSIGTVTFRVVYDTAGASSPPPGPGPVMKSTSKETTPSVAAAVTTPVVKPIPANDNSEPLEIGEFDFEETVRPGSDTVSPALVTESSKTPSGPLVIPTIKVGESAKKPAAAEKPTAAPMIAATAKPATPVPAPAAAIPAPPSPPPATPASAPLAKLIVPAAPPPAPAKATGITVPDTEEKAEEEDDFQDFLKSLGK